MKRLSKRSSLASYYLISFSYQETELFAYMESVLLMEHSKYITMGYGNLFVIVDGTQKRVLLLVGSWVSVNISPILVKEFTMVIGLIM